MKIAFLTPEYPNPRTGISGGIGTSIMNLSGELVKEGHEVAILVYGQDKDELFNENGLSFHKIKNVKFKGLSWYLTRKKIEKLINKLHGENKIDLVEAPDWTGITSFIKPKCPVIIRLHGSDTYFCHLDKRPVKWHNRFHEKRALENADQLLSVSQYTADVTNELFALNREFTVIPNGIDVQKFNPESKATKPIVLYFGTLIRKKGLLELPHIFNILHEKNNQAQLILVGRDNADVVSGNPSTWKMMQPLFSEAAFKNVQYLGSVGYDEIKSYILDAAVCVFPTFAEALPVSWIEAMAMQKAVVASDIGWAKEVIDNEKDGFLVHPTNHKVFAERVFELLANVDLRQTIGKNARETVMGKFDIAVVAKKNADFYNSAIKP
ncbi:MAG TPA: glycosyltransferase family 4 protein [Flavobacterium sp.]|nr:glycosyltransferase family 4 protein [Flavobacterium sp.]